MFRAVTIHRGQSYSWIDFEGCVYNLETTDMISELFQKYGTDCVHHINGDFAFVLYDVVQNQLFGAVDRLGAKTLYYHFDDKCFEYSTAFLPLCNGKNYTINCYARQCYFTMQYIPSPHTIVNEIKKLNPGECFSLFLDSGELKIWQYWDLYDNSCGFDKPKSYEEAQSVCQELIEDSVRLRMRHEKKQKLGTFLSGGIDSSIVNMFVAHQRHDITAYSVSFGESDWDESKYAKSVAEKLGIGFESIRCSASEAIVLIDGLQQYYDEPMGDASMIPTSFLCEKAGEHLDIALGGDGGDEMFFGYPRYLRYAGRKNIYRVPKGLRNALAVLSDAVGKNRIATSLRMKNVQELYMNRRPSNDAELFDALKIQQSLEQCKYLYADNDIRRCFNDFDIKTLMCQAYNVKLDRAALRGHLIARSPLLDYRIAEYTRLLPIDYCYTPVVGQKRVLRDLLCKELPRELFERKKRGFGVPVGQWFREELKDYLVDVLNENTVSLLPDFDGKKLIRVRDRHIEGKEDQTTLLWLCVNYIAWYNLFKRYK